MTIVPFDPSVFSAIDGLPLPLSARMQYIKKKSLSANIGFLQHFFFIDKTSFFLLFGDKRLIAKHVRVNYYTIWSFNFFLQILVLN